MGGGEDKGRDRDTQQKRWKRKLLPRMPLPTTLQNGGNSSGQLRKRIAEAQKKRWAAAKAAKSTQSKAIKKAPANEAAAAKRAPAKAVTKAVKKAAIKEAVAKKAVATK